MNARIRELAEQATTYHYGGLGTEIELFDREKFAELIIQECLLSLEPDSMAPAINYDVEEKFYQRSADKIRQHFGVSE